ncbi:unnamed protein product [Camellia sinensis]
MAFSRVNAIKEFDASIDFYWALLLVQSNSDDLINHRIPNWIVRVQAIEKHARYWVDADILVFISYIWWRRPKLKWGSFGSSDGIYKEVDMLLSYELALRTWLDWLNIHINRTKTKCSSQACTKTKCSSQACHPLTRGWGMPPNQKCNNETKPISKGHWGFDSDPRMMRVVEATIDELKERGLKCLITTTIINQANSLTKGSPKGASRNGDKPDQSQHIVDQGKFVRGRVVEYSSGVVISARSFLHHVKVLD